MHLKEYLIRHEANRLKPYLDCCGKYWRLCECKNQGKLTIGVGRNLDDNGITIQESAYLLDNDMANIISMCRLNFHWFDTLDQVRQDVIASMVFNMGIQRFFGFKNVIIAMEAKDYKRAAGEMLDSIWANQVGYRAEELARMMATGNYLSVI